MKVNIPKICNLNPNLSWKERRIVPISRMLLHQTPTAPTLSLCPNLPRYKRIRSRSFRPWCLDADILFPNPSIAPKALELMATTADLSSAFSAHPLELHRMPPSWGHQPVAINFISGGACRPYIVSRCVAVPGLPIYLVLHVPCWWSSPLIITHLSCRAGPCMLPVHF
jgi:hypothetical protein